MDWHIPVFALALLRKKNKSTNICRGDKRLSGSVQLLGILSALTEGYCVQSQAASPLLGSVAQAYMERNSMHLGGNPWWIYYGLMAAESDWEARVVPA